MPSFPPALPPHWTHRQESREPPGTTGGPRTRGRGSCSRHRVRGLVDGRLHSKRPVSSFLLASQRLNLHRKPHGLQGAGGLPASARPPTGPAAGRRSPAHGRVQLSGPHLPSHSGNTWAAPFPAFPQKHWDDLPSAVARTLSGASAEDFLATHGPTHTRASPMCTRGAGTGSPTATSVSWRHEELTRLPRAPGPMSGGRWPPAEALRVPFTHGQ